MRYFIYFLELIIFKLDLGMTQKPGGAKCGKGVHYLARGALYGSHPCIIWRYTSDIEV